MTSTTDIKAMKATMVTARDAMTLTSRTLASARGQSKVAFVSAAEAHIAASTTFVAAQQALADAVPSYDATGWIAPVAQNIAAVQADLVAVHAAIGANAEQPPEQWRTSR